MISSALDSESQKLGWIIPLPSVPESIEKASPGILKTLSLALQPEITHDLFLPVIFSIKLLLLANILLAMYLYSRVNLVVVLSTDLHFHLKSFTPYQQHFFTTFGAECVVTLLLLWGIGGTLFVSMIVFSDRIRQPHGIRWLFSKIVLPVSCATVMVCTVFHTQAPKLKPSEVRTGRFIGARMRPLAWLNHIYWLLEKSPSLVTLDEWRLANTLLDQLNKSTTSSRRYWGMNPVTGGDLEIEDSPGNFTVDKQDGKIIVRVYDSAGRAWLLTFPK